jgi:hypothetical protein
MVGLALSGTDLSMTFQVSSPGAPAGANVRAAYRMMRFAEYLGCGDEAYFEAVVSKVTELPGVRGGDGSS